MALTKDQAAEKVVARLINVGEKAEGLDKTDIVTWIDEALQRLARRVADSPEYYHLQKAVAISIVSGTASTETAAPVTSALLIDTLPLTGRAYVGSVPYKFVPRYESLDSAFFATDIGHYALVGKTIFITTETGNRTATVTLNATCSFIPTLGAGDANDLPVRFESNLIDTLIEMHSEKASMAAPTTVQE